MADTVMQKGFCYVTIPAMKTQTILVILGLFSIVSLLLSLVIGSVPISWPALIGQSHDMTQHVIWQLRWPVALTAFITGGLLALTGAILQVLLRNPLADPYILGISGGAATANLLGIVLGFGSHWLHLTGFLGALLAAGLVYILAQQQHRLNSSRLLLSGIIMATGWGALIALLLILSPDKDLRGMLFWLMGDLYNFSTPWWSLIILLLAAAYSLFLAPKLNILTRGAQQAQSLGINVDRLQKQLYFLTALLTACAVNLAGTIGFIGLIVPHMLRLLHKSDHRFILPASILLGGSLLTVANLLAKQLFAPVQLPVGIITALIGVPLFIILLLKNN